MAKNLWDIKQRFSHIKIGIFFLSGLVILLVTLAFIKDFTFFRPSYEVKVFFDFAEGIKRASPVRFCGVDVGQVREVIVVSSAGGPKVKVIANIDRGIKIPKGSYFFINSLSLFGEKYLEITPPFQYSEYIKKGGTVEGISPVPLFQVFAGFTQTMEELKSFIEEGEIKSSLENALKNLEDITLSVKGVVEDIQAEKGTVGRFLYDDSLYRKTEEFISDIKENPWKLLHKPRERR